MTDDGQPCENPACYGLGACCNGAECWLADAAECEAAGGRYLGDGATCEGGVNPCLVRGDLDCDGIVDAFDIDPFVRALTDPSGYAAAWPDCYMLNGDVNCDGAVNAFDIDAFAQCLTGGCPPCP